jgi:hypothetical protein
MPRLDDAALQAACRPARHGFDVFGYGADRRLERDLIAGYEKDVAPPAR